MTGTPLPDWASWGESRAWTLGAEEEVMLLDPEDWSLAQCAPEVLESLPAELADHTDGETHRSTLELRSDPHPDAGSLCGQLMSLRHGLAAAVEARGMRAGAAGLHGSTTWSDTEVTRSPRYDVVHDSMRVLARREPTFGLHLHVGVARPEEAVRLANRLRAHLPMLLALSANSPFWQGRETGMRSARTPLFQGFPRVGVPRAFADYRDWVEAVDVLLRCGAVPEPSFLWWDVRLQPRFGTVEVRVLDAQTEVADTLALVALFQSVSRLELVEGHACERLLASPEALSENRFLAARDGMDAELLDPAGARLVPAREVLAELLEACAPHAEALGCAGELALVEKLARWSGADRQLSLARAGGPSAAMAGLARAFLTAPSTDGDARRPAPRPSAAA
ncbi:MAG: YbdK family carboxylate-amine ligase [Actinomycetota bacterium]|nr:YbdK family carboxylate-amine ligase [Actinomycetota bacterium]